MDSSATTVAASDGASDHLPDQSQSGPSNYNNTLPDGTQLEPIRSTTSPHHHHHLHHVDTEEERQEKTQLAVAEGHDADIPSNIGYVLDEKGERKRRASIARRQSHASGMRPDLEKGDVPIVDGDAQRQGDESESSVDEDQDPNVVWWDGPDDPENPYNWPKWRKVVNIGLISGLTFLSPLGSSIFAPGVTKVMIEFESSSQTLAAFVVSVYVLGYAAGPMLFAPLSEIYGRTWVYHVCNVGFTLFLMGSALAPNLNALIVIRFFSGFFGSCPITNGGGSIADMIPQNQRAAYMSVYAMGPIMGPVIGPVVGGFVSDGPGWRWCFWILTIASGIMTVSIFIFLKETYAPVILARKAERLRNETGNQLLRSKLDIGLSRMDYFNRSIIRPCVMLIKSPICIIFALYTAIVYGYLYIMFTSISIIFEGQYGWGTGIVGLAFLGLGLGSVFGLLYYSWSSNRLIRSTMAKENEERVAQGLDPVKSIKPEYRLPPLLIGAPMLPVGLFLYGWTAEYEVHWIAPLIGTAIVGIGNIVVFMSLQMYLVDAFHMYAASALAANTVVRSIFGAVLPLAGLPMFDAIGVGWGNSILGFIAVAMTPLPFLIMKYGEYLRVRFEIKNL